MDFPFVGAEPPEDAIPDREAFVLFESAPTKADKAGIKKMLKAKWKLTFQKKAMSIAMPGSTPQRPLITFLKQTHRALPIALAFRGFRSAMRSRSRGHADALARAGRLVDEFDAEVKTSKSSIGRRFAAGLLLELWIADRPLTRAQRKLVEPAIENATEHRRGEFFHTMQNQPKQLMRVLDDIVWDDADALRALNEIVERLEMWGESLDGVRLEAALALAKRLGKELPETEMPDDEVSNVLWLAYQAGLQSDAKLCKKIQPLVKKHGSEGSLRFVYGDLRRAKDDPRLLKLAEQVLTSSADELYEAGCGMVRRSEAIALDLFDRSCRAPSPPWQAANNGVAMLLAVHPRKIPPKLAKLWLKRIEAEEEAAAKHNLACLLARLGRLDDARDALIEAIEGGADLEPIVDDPELKKVLGDEDVVAAIAARAPKKTKKKRR